LSVFLALVVTVSGLAKVAIFTTNVDVENQCLINHKCVCGALNRHFCQTRVTSWPSVHRHCQALTSIGFRCYCPTAYVSAVGGEKIKTPKGGKKKIEFVLAWGRHTLLQALARGLACVACKCV
jgi:hypothetical protein